MQGEDFINEFVEEARGHVEVIESLLLEKENINENYDAINSIFREVHSIKGTASFFGLKNIVDLAHAMENIFGEIRARKYKLTEKIIDIMLEANDNIRNMVENVYESDKSDISRIISEVEKCNKENEIIDTHNLEKYYFLLKSSEGKSYTLDGIYGILIDDAIKCGQKIYELKLQLNNDLLSYSEGPVKLFNNIRSVGLVIENYMDYSNINSLDDILSVEEDNDVYLAILAATNLKLDLFADTINIPSSKIIELKVEKYFENGNIVKENENSALINNAIPKNKINLEYNPNDNTCSYDKADAMESLDINRKNEEKTTDTINKISHKTEESIRINAGILNELLDMAGEMVLGRNQLLKTLEDYRESIPGLQIILQNIDKLTSGIQEKIMKTRMQPVANIFNKFPRIIRDISKKLSKEINLIIEDSGVELDKSMIEALSDPLTHLVRNSADHGIELPNIRDNNGKPKNGTIILKAFHESGYVNIEVVDDGAGIDYERVKQKAIERSIVIKQEAEKMSESEVLNLIFKPGFSTAEKITDVSGRGVGLDVVKTNVEAVGGIIIVNSVKGKGSTITLKIPLTLAIIDGMNLRVGDSRYTIPTTTIKEAFKAKYSDIIIDSAENEMIMVRGECYPILRIGKLYNVKNAIEEISEGIIIIVESNHTVICLAVDELLDEQQVVVKTLPKYLKKVSGLAGCTILGDGKISLILDVIGIMKLSKFKREKYMINM